MSNLGPLTTTFTAPSTCTYVSVQLEGSPSPTSTTFYNYVGKVWPSPLDCFPSGYPNAYTDRFSDYYSPGICPSGWTAYPTSDFPDPHETTALCCPPGFIIVGDTSDVFASSSPCFTTNEYTSTGTALIISGSIDIATKPYGDNTNGFITSTDYVMPFTGWNVFGIQVRYKPEDFLPHNSTTTSSSALPESTSSSNTLSTPTAGTTQSSVPAGDTNSNGNSTSTSTSTITGLSNGAKIGIGIGVPLFVILISAILAFILIRRRRRRQQDPPLPEDRHATKTPDTYNEFKAELPGNKPGTSGGERYAGKVELANTLKPSELEDPSTEWPLSSRQQPVHGSAVDLDAISSAQGTAHSDIGSDTVSPMETMRNDARSAGGASAAEEMETEQFKYRYIGEGSKVKKSEARGQP